ncbi:Betaine aldehyde dehydrogenase [compost metagenome]
MRDNGKPLARAAWDVAEAIGCFRYYAELARELDGRQDQLRDVEDAPFSCRVRHGPVGVVGQVIPWSYPLLMAAWTVAPALAAGATCVLLSSELTPLSALELGLAASRVELPPGVLNVLSGYRAQAGRILARHPGVDRLAFDGVLPNEVRSLSAAAADIRNISLELGGKSTLILFDDVDIEVAVEWIIAGCLWNQGQVGSALSRVLVQERIAPRLLERLVQAAQEVKLGPGMVEGVQVGPLINSWHHRQVMMAIEQGRQDGRLLIGGRRPRYLPTGYFIEPALFYEPDIRTPLWRGEILGPVLCLKCFRTEAEALALASHGRPGLAAAVMSADSARADRVANGLRADIVWLNGSPATVPPTPWSGGQPSGIGGELGRWGLENYLDFKQVTRYRRDESDDV